MSIFLLFHMYCLILADGLAIPTGDCADGWFCSGAATMSKPILVDNTTDPSTCSCPDSGYTGGRCWPGTFCPSGSYYPISCSNGSYCDAYELATPSGLCNAGYYCDGNISRPDPPQNICPMGSYCEEGSSTPSPCPAGTMNNVTGGTDISFCKPCTAGSYCAGPGDYTETGPCREGYYCPPGEDTDTPAEYNCTIGHYCPTGTPDPVPCESGTYSDEILQPLCKACPAGRYCDQAENGGGVVVPVDCPAGKF